MIAEGTSEALLEEVGLVDCPHGYLNPTSCPVCSLRPPGGHPDSKRPDHQNALQVHSADLAALIGIAGRGLRVFPCVTRKKIPIIKNWQNLATTDLRQIEAWAKQYKGCNWGVATGPKSGVFVLDVDGQKGSDSITAMEECHGSLPRTLQSRTARGVHYWFRYPNGHRIKGIIGRIAIGLDIRGAGNLVLAPPSVHPSGTRYVWIDDQEEVASAPEWLLAMISAASESGHCARPTRKDGVSSEMLPEGEILTHGIRNDQLHRLAGALRRKGSNEAEIYKAVVERNNRDCLDPLPDSELHDLARKACKYPIGGADPLELAWQSVLSGSCSGISYVKFLLFVWNLVRQINKSTVALPIVRISRLHRVHHTLISRHRERARGDGILRLEHRYVREIKQGAGAVKGRAAIYSVDMQELERCLTIKYGVSLSSVSLSRDLGLSAVSLASKGLVRQQQNNNGPADIEGMFGL